jgi:hypothetical protein
MLDSKLHQILQLPMGALRSLYIFDDGMLIAMSTADYYSSRGTRGDLEIVEESSGVDWKR